MTEVLLIFSCFFAGAAGGIFVGLMQDMVAAYKRWRWEHRP
jgi:hypothetical protein